MARQKVKNKLFNILALWYIHDSHLLTYFNYEVRTPPDICPLLCMVFKFQRNTGESCSLITPILGTIPCKHTARSTLTNYQSNTSLHRWKVLQEAANAKSTRNVGGKAMKKKVDSMEEGLTGLAVLEALSDGSDRP